MAGPKVTTEAVQTFCRLRPSFVSEDIESLYSSDLSRYSELHARFVEHCEYEILSPDSISGQGQNLRIFEPQFMSVPVNVPRLESSSNFMFDHVFKEDASQSDVFQLVGRPMLDSFLKGINGCVFCYGQTGAGKTWTMSGADSFDSRGLIQRFIEALFADPRNDLNSSLALSYMEIYNEQAYDLLDDATPRVTFRQDSKGTLQYENLSTHLIEGPETALDLLLRGNLNRIVAPTPMNQVSSRSHCVFTIHWQSEMICSKVHFVDLAGSERVLRSGVAGTTLREAQNINKSLFHLEHVISQLATFQKHIAYRNSVLTSFLKDSLGGSCRTAMVANISLEKQNFKESVSTCRFAQRCGQIKTRVAVNQYTIRSFSLPQTTEFSSEVLASDSLFPATLSTLNERFSTSRPNLLPDFRRLGMQLDVHSWGDVCALINEFSPNRQVQQMGDIGTEMVLETRHEWTRVLPGGESPKHVPLVEIEDLMTY